MTEERRSYGRGPGARCWTGLLRGAPPGLPFRFDPDTVQRGLNFTLRTTRGDIDLLGEVVGGGGSSSTS